MPNKSSPHGGFISEGTVSHGTLRTQDLLRSFADEYERVLPFNSSSLCSEAREAADMLDKPTARQPQGFAEIADDILTSLFDSLQTVAARENLTFGAHDGDGSDFGYWAGDADDGIYEPLEG